MKTPYIIEIRIDEFHEKDEEDGWKAVLSITITLIAEKNIKKVIFQKQYQEEEKLSIRNPSGLAAAISQTFEKTSKSIIIDVYNQIVIDANQ
jgi:ABC-type uncharacterized transport system auxiliary subunit